MKSTGALQVVIILLLVASAASCEVGKEYANRVFKPTAVKKADSTAIRFMEFDSGNASDSIDMRDFASKEIKDSSTTEVPVIETQKPITAEAQKPIVETKKPIFDRPTGNVRTKRVRQ